MAIKLIDTVLDEIVTYFTANMTAKLTALDVRYGDSITLTPIAAYYKAEPSVKSVPLFPVIVVLAEETEVEKWSGTYLDAFHHILMDVLVQDADPEVLGKRIRRHALAIFECLVEGHAAGSISPFQMGESTRLIFSDVATRGGELLQAARVRARFKLQEDF